MHSLVRLFRNPFITTLRLPHDQDSRIGRCCGAVTAQFGDDGHQKEVSDGGEGGESRRKKRTFQSKNGVCAYVAPAGAGGRAQAVL